MCNLYSITTNQAAIAALFRVVDRYVGNLAPMPGVFPDYPAPVIRNTADGTQLTMMRWGMPPPPRTGGTPVTNTRNTSSPHWCGCRRGAASNAAVREVGFVDAGASIGVVAKEAEHILVGQCKFKHANPAVRLR